MGPIAALSRDQRDLKDSALRSISNALDETYLYYRDIDSGKPRNLDREGQLVKYWSAAAIPIRHFDENLAQICDEKAEFWLAPQSYSPEDISELGISLNNVRGAYRKLKNPYYSTFKNKKRGD